MNTVRKSVPGSYTAVLGASPKPDRYSHMALNKLMAAGYKAIPVNPVQTEIDGIPCVADLHQAAKVAGEDGLDTLTLYLAPPRLEPLIDDIVTIRPGRVIFNPGTETERVQKALDAAGIPWLEACTLVLLTTRQF